MAEAPSFRDYNLPEPLLQALDEANYIYPTDIQAAMIPIALTGQDVLGQAKTGTGKTVSYLVPILANLQPGPETQAVILAPTRELSLQICDEVFKLTKHLPFRACAIYGGQDIRIQLQELRHGVQIAVGTPGRIIDHLKRRTLHLNKIQFVVLDEADRMLDMGFRDDIKYILGHANLHRQTFLLSATMPPDIMRLAERYLHNHQDIILSRDDLTVDEVEQHYVSVTQDHKFEYLLALLAQEGAPKAIIFTRTKIGADKLGRRMKDHGLSVHAIHGDLHQLRREKIMEAFRHGEFQYMVATDVAARGLDVRDISHIINYDIPEDAESYVHRIGRTARMGAIGKAVTFVTPEEGGELTSIEMLINREIVQMRLNGVTPVPRRPAGEGPAPAPGGSRGGRRRFGPGRGRR
ncbi:MAG: DEAD/DEAH box helicase [Planctomycetes bacterium]|nr:DEAD/DEAH box helicase [Planctomycetota bacterium]